MLARSSTVKRFAILVLSFCIGSYTVIIFFDWIRHTDSSGYAQPIGPRQSDTQSKGLPVLQSIRNSSIPKLQNDRFPSKKTHFVYIRVEKTGSTVLRTLFYSFAMRHKLNMMRTGLDEPDLMSTNDETRGKLWQIGPRGNDPPDMVSEHAWYNEVFFTKNFPKDTVYLASVRNPITWFKSFVKFMKFYRQGNITHHQVLSNDSLFNRDNHIYMAARCTNMKKLNRNRQLQWLGFNAARDSSNKTAIRNHIDYISKRFKLILINEYFDESLILLRRLMNWSFSDIFYKSYNMTPKSKDELTEEEQKKLIDINHNYGDWQLYQHFNQTLWQQIKAEPDFYKELRDFQRENKRVYKWCHLKPSFPGERLVITTRWEPAFDIVSGDCLRMSIQRDIKLYHNLDIPTFEEVADQYSQIFN